MPTTAPTTNSRERVRSSNWASRWLALRHRYPACWALLVYGYVHSFAECRGQVAGTMSGGEHQQFAICRGTGGQPEGVQPSIVQMIFRVPRAASDVVGTTIVFVEQNPGAFLSIVEHYYMEDKGRVTAELGRDAITTKAVRGYLMIRRCPGPGRLTRYAKLSGDDALRAQSVEVPEEHLLAVL
ncbi:hypothetical protein [Methylobacterium frigidaeris]|uniref:Uncharacterized protein n=1 Tax=Methylobacterium frigidaeris TaxID=2038277 RepID=A0AA37HI86_9HYPH|nr:hypothetical protein [Methylobacterium frigidaeris]GJD66021.1 hypothetical protein MPEAHAMD_6217 [Methylobacterium frigidaeris]